MLQKRFIAAWRDAADARSVDALDALLADRVELVSPVSFKPITDRQEIRAVFAAVLEVLPDLRYTRSEKTETGAVMIFEGTVQGTLIKVEGVDVFTLGLDGRVYEIKIFIRPLKAANAFAEAMAKVLAR